VLGRAIGLFALVSLLAAPAAGAATPLAFDREIAEPGEAVEVFTSEGGREDALPPGNDAAYTVYLVRVGLVEELLGGNGGSVQREPETGEGVILLGVLERDDESVGRLSFTIPELEPGRYTTGVWCVSCGGTFETSYRPGATPAGEHGLVLRVVPRGEAEDGGTAWGTIGRGILIAGAVLALLLVGYVVVTNRRRRQSVLR
jgi:hypothetical protein